jgi:hypothetical protein
MKTYKLDDLQNWGRVLEQLEELKELRLLDEHQEGLKRILRYTGNWSLRECAMKCVQEVAAPKNALLQEVCAIMCDEDVYPELRTLAVDTLRKLILANASIGSLPYHQGATILEKMKALVGVPMHPLLQRRIARAIEEIAVKEASSHDHEGDIDR